MCINTGKAQRELIDKAPTISVVNLTDPSKVPKEIIVELFEQFQVNKVNYSKIPDFDPKDKTTLTSAELLAYLKSLIKEL